MKQAQTGVSFLSDEEHWAILPSVAGSRGIPTFIKCEIECAVCVQSFGNRL